MQDVATRTWSPEATINCSWLPDQRVDLRDLNPDFFLVENANKLQAICQFVPLRISIPEQKRYSGFHLVVATFLAGYASAGSLAPSPGQDPLFVSGTDSHSHLFISLELEERLKELSTRLETLRKFAQEDNSSDIDWPSEQACKDAELFIRLLPLSEIVSPNIYFAHDGEINFLWKRQNDELHVDLGFYGDGTYSFFATNNSREELMDDMVKISDGLPDKLIDMLRV